MPSKSSASLSVLPSSRAGRLRAPPSLGEAERTVFVDLVAACKPSQFQTSDLPLLCRYCEQAVLAEQAAIHLRTEGPVLAGRVNPWITVQEKAIRGLVALSMRLRLSPQARQANNPTRPQPANIYERMAIHDQEE